MEAAGYSQGRYGTMSKWKVVVTARSFGQSSEEPMRILTEAGCDILRSSQDRPLASDEMCDLATDADALIVGNDVVDEKVISAARRLRVISRYGVGVDNIDILAATRRRIPVTNTPGANDDAVADLTIGLMIAVARHIPRTVAMVKSGQWKRVMGSDISGKTLGIIGLGKIGKKVAERAKGFSMRLLCYDMMQDCEFASKFGVEYVALDYLLANADFVTIHTPLTEETRGLIGEKEFALMKPSVYVINTARGGVVDERALYDALTRGKISGAALDVLEVEPPFQNPLLTLENVIVTSHIGGYTSEGVRNMGMIAARNVVTVLKGGKAEHTVNPEVYVPQGN